MSCDENKISDQIDGGLSQQKEDRQILLDHFAGLALQSGISNPNYTGVTWEGHAISSYDIAEAMLAERERRMKG